MPSFMHWVTQDWSANRHRRESQLILLWFRSAQWSLRHWGRVGRRLADLYRVLSSMGLSVELPAEASIGRELQLYHPHGIVLHPETVMGARCVLRHNVTIGNTTRSDGHSRGVPVVGNDVDLGAGSMVLGPISVGDRARIGAAAVVLRDVPPDAVAVGNPARVIDRAGPGAGTE